MLTSRENIPSKTLYNMYCLLDLLKCEAQFYVHVYTIFEFLVSYRANSYRFYAYVQHTQTSWVSNTYSTSLQSNTNALHTTSGRNTITAG